MIFEHLLQRALAFQETILGNLVKEAPLLSKQARSFKEIADVLMGQLEVIGESKPTLSCQDVQTERMCFDKNCQTFENETEIN